MPKNVDHVAVQKVVEMIWLYVEYRKRTDVVLGIHQKKKLVHEVLFSFTEKRKW